MTLTSHQYWDDGHMFGWSWVAMVVLMVGFWAIIVWLGITLARRPSACDAPRPPHDWTTEMGTSADEYVAVMTLRAFSSVGHFYDDFRPVTDEQVIESLRSRDV
jgi:hypothetical protein